MNARKPGFEGSAAATVRRAAPHEWGDALAILVQAPESERAERVREALQAVAEGGLSLAGLWVAERRGGLVGAALSVSQPDGIAFVWPPAVALGDEAGVEHRPRETVEDALWDALTAALDVQGHVCAQCLLEPADPVDREQLARHGFHHAADLETMDRLLSEPLPERRPAEWSAVPYDPARSARRFAAVIEQTYLGSRDCPAFTARRSGEDALRSHQNAGVFEPSRWTLFEVSGSDAGLLLLSLHPDGNACEVVYMGVVPEHRGKGLGRAMLIEGLHAAAGWGCDSMFLAVDSANHYAKEIYRSLGFLPRGLREAWVRWPARRISQEEHSPAEA